MQRVLVANRGEIALRAIRACRQLGHQSLAVFSSADANSPHRWAADHAICIGPPSATASYLNVAALLETGTAIASRAWETRSRRGELLPRSEFPWCLDPSRGLPTPTAPASLQPISGFRF